MLTRGRLVPRQPRAIKGTTRTELRGESIHSGEHIHWNINITPTLLRGYNIQNSGYIHWNIGITTTALRGCNIRNGGCIHWEFTAIPMALHANTIPFCTSFIFRGYSL